MILSVQDKSNTVERLKKDESACNLIAEYDAGKSVISDIKDSESKLFQLRKNLYESNLRLRGSLKISKNDKLDRSMYKRILQKRSTGTASSGPLIQEEAVESNAKLGNNRSFKASTGWLKRFELRYGTRKLDLAEGKLSADSSTAREFLQVFNNSCERKGLRLRSYL